MTSYERPVLGGGERLPGVDAGASGSRLGLMGPPAAALGGGPDSGGGSLFPSSPGLGAGPRTLQAFDREPRDLKLGFRKLTDGDGSPASIAE